MINGRKIFAEKTMDYGFEFPYPMIKESLIKILRS